MCDLLAPLLVIYDDGELLVYSFTTLNDLSCRSARLRNVLTSHGAYDAQFPAWRHRHGRAIGQSARTHPSRRPGAVRVDAKERRLHALLFRIPLDSARSQTRHVIDLRISTVNMTCFSELRYSDVFHVWEVIWACTHLYSDNFTLFVSLALVLLYRDIIISNSMDFTDIIKFFNGIRLTSTLRRYVNRLAEMAENHDRTQLLMIARAQLHRLRTVVHDEL